MWCKWTALSAAGLGRWHITIVVLAGLAAAHVPSVSAQEAALDDPADETNLTAGEADGVTGDDLYKTFKNAFEAAGGAKSFRIGVAPARGVTPPGDVKCLADVDLVGGTVDIVCENLSAPADVYLVDNQPVEGDSVLPEAHDSVILVGRLEAGPDGSANLGADLGDGFFDEAEVDVVVLVPADADPTAAGALVAIGGPTAFMRRFWRETRAGAKRHTNVVDHALGGDPRVRLGLVDRQVLRGANLFFRERFKGNGRTCATCHRAEANLGLDPTFVRQLRRRELDRFGGLKDPLFVAHPRFIGRHPVPKLEVPFLVNRHAMIRENIDGFESPAKKFVMRGVPHSLSQDPTVDLPGPEGPEGTLPDGSTVDVEERTGWSGDGAPVTGRLRLFPVGAVIQHFRRQFDNIAPGRGNFRLPNDGELDAMEHFMRTSGRITDIDLDGLVLANEEANGGVNAFRVGDCGLCHANAGANVRADIIDRDSKGLFGEPLGNANFNTGVERLDTAARELFRRRKGREMPCDGGFGGQGLDAFNVDSDCGIEDDEKAAQSGRDAFGNGGFNTVTVIESADTGPFFHNNSVDTMEEAVAFYRSDLFNASPAAERFGIDLSGLPDTAIINIAAFLRTMNAGLNLRIAQQRCGAAAKIIREAIHTSGGENRKTRRLVNRLVELANEELKDVRTVLRRKDAEIDDEPLELDALYPDVRKAMKRVIAANKGLLNLKNSRDRRTLAASCRVETKAARESLTDPEESATVVNFRVGAGNLTF